MTINQLVFNTPTDEIISVSFELEQFISHTTTDSEIEQVVRDVSDVVRKHFNFYRDQKVKNENLRLEVERLAQEKNQKTAKTFSSFKKKGVFERPSAMTTTGKSHTIEDVIPILASMNKVAASYLPNVYRFPGSAYAYTVKDNTWMSPFGEEGKGVQSFLEDIAKRVFRLEGVDSTDFISSVTSQLK